MNQVGGNKVRNPPETAVDVAIFKNLGINIARAKLVQQMWTKKYIN